MASAASETSGLPATTFNPAGLNARKATHPLSSNIDEVYVKGEALHESQAIPGMPKSAATRTWPLEPADGLNQTAVAALKPFGGSAVGAALAVRGGMLHMMSAVNSALAMKNASVAKALVANGCP